ncbi:unnamed protein product (macronuclear) [Paramecium tetraurelia]|uniref:Uncharacterized protein n=1 Tax=Paramecium tetraurelia TaxID=5888 RepID=A0CBM6_PARTE|nr:uncharacterized protein GSPATT00036976001 [Paramecium tetraurelia]CAK68193.1 unnamed protein product [Paramecium tetraurelia]|eukprot:XP_001435590.1 hypothetical protein (macronuclear) [Paramecium tetraurelia strain d4-2]
MNKYKIHLNNRYQWLILQDQNVYLFRHNFNLWTCQSTLITIIVQILCVFEKVQKQHYLKSKMDIQHQDNNFLKYYIHFTLFNLTMSYCLQQRFYRYRQSLHEPSLLSLIFIQTIFKQKNMKVQDQNFLKQISIILIFVANLTQCFWWIFLATNLMSTINYELFILQIVCILARICQYYIIRRGLDYNIFLHVVSLLYFVIYVESLLILNYTQTFYIVTNCLLMIINYNTYLKKARQKSSLICRLGLPTYLFIRTIWMVVCSQNYQTLECLTLIGVVLVHQGIKNYKKFGKYERFPQNFYLKTFKQGQIIQNQQNEETPAPAKNYLMHSLIRSQSKITLVQSPKKYFTIQLKDLPDELKLKRYSHLTSFSKSQKNILSQGNSQYQMLQLYSNLINIFPYGILIINEHQSINFINNKCEKILECQGIEQVLEKVKMCVNTAKIQENVSETSNKQQKKQHHYQLLQQIIKKLQISNNSVDVLDIILQPQKYFGILGQNESQFYKDFQQAFHQQIFIYEWLIKSEQTQQNYQKKLKLIIMPTSMTNQQQEYISASSQFKSSIKSHISNNQSDQERPVMLIIIKNVTNKYKCQQMRDEQIIHHSLIKSFSHELRTPLNSCYQMLNLMRCQQISKAFSNYIDIAQCSITLLIHQINDILDYAALQSFSFNYNIANFKINQITQEIEDLYKLQVSQKNIALTIKVSDYLAGRIFRNDKQRIIQLLVNLLNNAIKFTPQGGSIFLSVIEVDQQYINFSVKDNGIGIDEHKLNKIQNCLHNTIEFGAVLKSHSKIKQPGLGLIIAAKLIEGLTESKENKLTLSSKKNKGTMVQFQIEDLQQTNLQSIYLSNQQGEKLNNLVNRQENNVQNLDQDKVFSLSNKTLKLDNDVNLQEGKSESFITLRLNDSEKQPEIFLPISPEYFSKKILDYHNKIQKQLPEDYFQNADILCQNCVHILIVDDIPFNQIALKMILSKYKIEVDQAFDGFQAIEKVKQKMLKHCQNYKLIFMDIEMPGMDGFQASQQVNFQDTKQILELTSNQAFIVICSAYDTQENIQQGKNIGINTFLQKPVKQDELNVLLGTVFKIESNSNFYFQQ